VTPRLQHANSAVVLAAIKVLMKLLDRLEREKMKEITKKMRPPLVTMLSKEPEIQYVALRNINLILQKRPNILNNEMKFFFCHYNDPLYVKMEKLEIMIMLTNEKNIDQVLLELKEYCNRADVEFVRKSVRAIGRSAIKLEKSAEKCVQVLLELIKSTRHSYNYVVQEAVVVIKDIFRRYAHQYDHIIGTLLADSLVDHLDEPDAKASIVWIIGEYADKIPNAKDLIKSFLGTFKDEAPPVQLQLLTAVVKLFLKEPENTQQMAQDTLHLAMNEIDNPDTRDRAFLYGRLLTVHPSAAKSVVCSLKPLLSDDSEHLDTPVLDELISNISTLASVYHKPPSSFVKAMRNKGHVREQDEEEKPENDESLILPNTGDLLGGFAERQEVLPPLLAPQAQTANGLQINGKFIVKGDSVELKLQLTNHSSTLASEFQIKFKQNVYNIDPSQNTIPVQPIGPGNSLTYSLPCIFNKTDVPSSIQPSSQIQVALKNSLGVAYFFVNLPLNMLLSLDGRQEKNVWLSTWRTIEKENYFDITNMTVTSLVDIQSKLEASRIFYVAHRNVNGQDYLYMSAKLIEGSIFLLEISQMGGPTCKLCVKTLSEHLALLLAQSIQSFLSS
jgi:AP-1 complex subunit beta-1